MEALAQELAQYLLERLKEFVMVSWGGFRGVIVVLLA